MPAATVRALALLALALVGACDEDEESGQTYACRYDYSTYSVSEYGIDYEEHPGNCTEVSSPSTCDAITKSSNDCNGGFCSEWTYFNVSVTPGTCDAPAAGPADDASSPSGGGGGGECPWTNDGECDEALGTGLCAAGTDTADCACAWPNDGECDEPEGTGLCAEGTDSWDC